ncbi:CAAX protease self-immunity [Thomasclavelia cocleata]|uniref:CAAX protease self-immunity n=2 Tax=Thomasclavelia cocleata TaxID=69824 RepID=A0A1I0D1N1_9FIRM|nr:type II CAAX endopeptidase family protein [Thomasclavelia cocleata]MCR1959716.1 CPBP family intramembrane metalloprotease [Thomasclavelia cocleata]NDO41092.1 CPBP family intramembrane metalloprotease [Thomasclavelia cocleata]SET25831.1 CAAX protease self-immunity [Thomasclavelia cocleata]
MNSSIQFGTDVKKLNRMLLLYIFLETLVMLIIEPVLMALKFGEDLIFFLAPAITTCFVTYYLVKRYQKKFELTIPLKISDDFKFIQYLKFVVMALGAAWLTSLVIGFIMNSLSGIVIFETPDFSTKDNFIVNICLIIYAVIVAPISEELIFRGLILGKLKQYGDVFASIIVSLLFALIHGNLPQSIPTFIVSLFLCWVTLQSNSIIPAISIHMINNAVAQLGDINNEVFQLVINILIVIIIIIAVVLIVKEFRNRSEFKLQYRVKDYFKNVSGIVILILSILMIIGSIKIV